MKKIFTISILLIALVNGVQAQYCPLTTGSPYDPNMPGVTLFQLAAMTRTSTNVESATGTIVSTGMTATVTAGQTYTISLRGSEDAISFQGARNNLRVWVDFNNNFSFTDAGETILSQNLVAPNTIFTTTVTIPATAPTGTARMRVTAKMSADAGHSIPTPCDIPADPIGYHGEMEDYSLYILPGTPPATTHCTFPGRTPYSANTPGITNVKLFTINRTSAASESTASIYVLTGQTTTLALNKSYSMSVTHSKDNVNYPNATNNIRVWIDWNKNFDFVPNELMLSANQQAAGTFTGTFTVPATASLGTTVMRVMVKQGTEAGNQLPTPCDEPQDPQGFRGEVEDYNIVVAATPPNLVGLASENLFLSGSNVFPNPTKENLSVSIALTESLPVSVTLYDLNGRAIYTILTEKTMEAGSNLFSVNLKEIGIANGVYIVKIQAGNESTCKRVVKLD